MSIKSFLHDLSQAFRGKGEGKRHKDELVRQREKDKQEFFEQFVRINNGIVNKVRQVEKEVKEDFKLRYKSAPGRPSSYVLEGSVSFQPRFVSDVYEVRLVVQGHYKERKLLVLGTATYRLSAEHKTPIEAFNDDIRLFDPEQTEGYITNILRHYFIRP